MMYPNAIQWVHNSLHVIILPQDVKYQWFVVVLFVIRFPAFDTKIYLAGFALHHMRP